MTGLNIGARIREHRTALGMSQEELAEACLCSRQTISNWETNKTLPDVQSLKYLATAFDTTVDDLIAEDGPKIIRRTSADRRELQVLLVAEFALIACMIPTVVYDFLHPGSGAIWLLATPALCEIALTAREVHLHRKHDLSTLSEVGDYIEGKQPKPRKVGRIASFLEHHWLLLALILGVAIFFIGESVFAR